jgi:hypothetical protein
MQERKKKETILQRRDRTIFDSESDAYGENLDEIDEEELDLCEQSLTPPY